MTCINYLHYITVTHSSHLCRQSCIGIVQRYEFCRELWNLKNAIAYTQKKESKVSVCSSFKNHSKPRKYSKIMSSVIGNETISENLTRKHVFIFIIIIIVIIIDKDLTKCNPPLPPSTKHTVYQDLTTVSNIDRSVLSSSLTPHNLSINSRFINLPSSLRLSRVGLSW